MLNSRLPLFLFLALLLQPVLAETQYGLEMAPQELRQKHLDHFMKLYREFCYDKVSQEEVKTAVTRSGRFRPAKEFDGIYETDLDGLSYAITPDPEYCTVDVKLAYASGRLLFSQADIEEAIKAMPEYGYRLASRKRETHQGPDGEQVEVELSSFYPAEVQENRILLIYPLNHQDVYYMTLDFNYQ